MPYGYSKKDLITFLYGEVGLPVKIIVKLLGTTKYLDVRSMERGKLYDLWLSKNRKLGGYQPGLPIFLYSTVGLPIDCIKNLGQGAAYRELLNSDCSPGDLLYKWLSNDYRKELAKIEKGGRYRGGTG